MVARKSRTNHWDLAGTSFWTLISAKLSDGLKCANVEASLAAIRAQKEDPVNGQRVVSNSRTTMGKLRPIRHSGRLSFRALIADKDIVFLGAIPTPLAEGL